MAVLHVVCVMWLGRSGEEGRIGKGAEREGGCCRDCRVCVAPPKCAHCPYKRGNCARNAIIARLKVGSKTIASPPLLVGWANHATSPPYSRSMHRYFMHLICQTQRIFAFVSAIAKAQIFLHCSDTLSACLNQHRFFLSRCSITWHHLLHASSSTIMLLLLHTLRRRVAS